ncbi:MAG: glycosyl hydrolase family 28-related protein, partial [Planctomycetota bacterium]|nr:glycosyl hydrolase family 28-related protein [Planctomycetota bacterium]
MTTTLTILLAVAAAQPQAEPRQGAALLTVRDFGASGDGQADDTAAIQRAADRGGEIRFPRGTYRISRPVVIDLDRAGHTSIVADGTASLRMAGPGPALKLVGTHAGTASPDSVKENVWQRQRTPMIDGLEIVGEHPEAIGLWLEGTFQPVITRVCVRGAL